MHIGFKSLSNVFSFSDTYVEEELQMLNFIDGIIRYTNNVMFYSSVRVIICMKSCIM